MRERILSIAEAQLIINQKLELDSLCRFGGKSVSQHKQDIFVLSESGFKRGGYFVEFGALDGVTDSNTYLLEKEFGWAGILAEPNKSMYSTLIKNRSCHIEDKCVWKCSNEVLKFKETSNVHALSTILDYVDSDRHKDSREPGVVYDVSTISLQDMLIKYNAPKYIDYLSIDTEGSELEILAGFDFDRWYVKVITCEHNFTPQREIIYTYLTKHGYVRKYENLSQDDDWYVRVD